MRFAGSVSSIALEKINESIVIEAETVFADIAFEKESRMTTATEVGCPAVNAVVDDKEIEDVAAQILLKTTWRFKSTYRDSNSIKSRGCAIMDPPMMFFENMLTLGIEWASSSLYCHQKLSPYTSA